MRQKKLSFLPYAKNVERLRLHERASSNGLNILLRGFVFAVERRHVIDKRCAVEGIQTVEKTCASNHQKKSVMIVVRTTIQSAK